MKYTIRSIVCEASCHSVILSSCHSVIPSSRHPIILSSCHQSVFNIATNRRTNKQHHELLQVCFADKNTKHGDQVSIITRPYIGSVCNSVDLDSNHSHSEQSGEHFFYIWTLGSNSVEIIRMFPTIVMKWNWEIRCVPCALVVWLKWCERRKREREDCR